MRFNHSDDSVWAFLIILDQFVNPLFAGCGKNCFGKYNIYLRFLIESNYNRMRLNISFYKYFKICKYL